MKGRLGIVVVVALSLLLVGCGSKPSRASTARAQQRQELQDYWNKASPKVRTCRQIDEALAVMARQLAVQPSSTDKWALRSRVGDLLVLESETVGQLSTISPPLSLVAAHGRLVSWLEDGCVSMTERAVGGGSRGQKTAGMENQAKAWASAVNHVAAELGLPQPLPTPRDTANPGFVGPGMANMP
jgi:hypothetical protein